MRRSIIYGIGVAVSVALIFGGYVWSESTQHLSDTDHADSWQPRFAAIMMLGAVHSLIALSFLMMYEIAGGR